MAKPDPTPDDESPVEVPAAPALSREETLAATEATNAARAVEDHVAPKHIDGVTLHDTTTPGE